MALEPRDGDDNARCPRCGGGFHCGRQDARCDCAQVPLDEATLARLQRQFQGCLCGPCLRSVQAEGDGAGVQGSTSR